MCHTIEKIFVNNFFKECLDASIPNNFDELNRIKKFNLVLRKDEYKTISCEGKTFKEALENFYNTNTDVNAEHESEYERLPNTWFVWGTTALEKLPENQSMTKHKDINAIRYVYNDARELGDIR